MPDIYRLEGFLHPTVKSTSVISEEDPKRLRRAFVDTNAIDALGRLVEGPIRSKADLQSFELAARAIVFHDEINLLAPCIDRTIYGSLEHNPVRISQAVPDGTKIPESLEGVLRDCKQHNHIIPVEKVLEFASDDIEKAILSQYVTKSESQKLWEQDKKEGVTSIVSLDRAYPVKLCNSVEEYFESIFISDPERISKVVSAIPETGSPGYFGLAEFRNVYETRKGFDPTKFFKIIDDSWADEVENLMSYSANIPIGFVSAILANKIDRREQLPEALAEMRAQFAPFRNQLWELYDDVNLRSVSFADQTRLLKSIEATAKALVPAAMQSGEFWLPLRFGFLKRLFLFDWVGLAALTVESFQEALRAPSASLHMVDLASPLSNELGQVDNLGYVLRKILSEAEIAQITNLK